MQCTLYANDAPSGGGICAGSLGLRHIGLDRTIIAGSTQGSAVYFYSGGRATLSCCDLWGNAGGDWTYPIASQLGQNGNISLDPEFCPLDTLEMYLQPGSPCGPAADPACGLIGAWDENCDLTAVSGGGLPSLYQLQARPNPFSTWTRISCLPPSGAVRSVLTVEIVDPGGRVVRSLRADSKSSGVQTLIWDGRNDEGYDAASGVYFCRWPEGGGSGGTRLILIR